MTVTWRDPVFSHERVENRRKALGIHFHSRHELYYLIDGETKYFIGDEVFLLKPGCFVLIPMGILHQADSEQCLYNERMLISFDDSMIDNQVRPILESLFAQKMIYVPMNKIAQIEELFQKIKTEYESSQPHSEILISNYIQTIIVLLNRLKEKPAQQAPELNAIINAIVAYIRENYAQELSLTMLSTKFGLSKSYLSRKFKTITGIGITECITNIRIHNAAMLLLQNKYPVSVIAEKCGFSDSNYFASVFKRIEGVTPLKYAQKNRFVGSSISAYFAQNDP